MRRRENDAEELYDRLRGIQDILVNNEFVLSVRSRKGTSKVEIEFEGTKEELMGGLAHIVDGLNTNSNLSKSDIREAVELGLRGLEAAKRETRRDLKKLLADMGIFDD